MVIAGDSIRARIVDIALGYVGCGITSDRLRYLSLIMGPGDTDEKGFEAMSGCALVARGILREAGCTHPLLAAPYRIGHAMSDLEEIARASGAWVVARNRRASLPEPGDMVVLESQTGGHAFTVVEVGSAPDRLVELVTVDGGQKDSHGRQLIAKFRRQWSQNGADVYDHACTTRRVRGWVDASRLDYAGGCC